MERSQQSSGRERGLRRAIRDLVPIAGAVGALAVVVVVVVGGTTAELGNPVATPVPPVVAAPPPTGAPDFSIRSAPARRAASAGQAPAVADLGGFLAGPPRAGAAPRGVAASAGSEPFAVVLSSVTSPAVTATTVASVVALDPVAAPTATVSVASAPTTTVAPKPGKGNTAKPKAKATGKGGTPAATSTTSTTTGLSVASVGDDGEDDARAKGDRGRSAWGHTRGVGSR